jgi:hypothetical protein
MHRCRAPLRSIVVRHPASFEAGHAQAETGQQWTLAYLGVATTQPAKAGAELKQLGRQL